MSILDLTCVHTYYGAGHILHGVNLSLYDNQATSLIGRNGAGKTTLMRTIMQLTPPKEGKVIFRNHTELQGMKPHRVYRLGIKLCPQGRGILTRLTVEENLQIALVNQKSVDKKGEFEKAFELFPVLNQKKRQRAGFLSGGERQMLAIARALLGNTVVLLLDEPSEGLAPVVVRELHDIILQLKTRGITILLAEQNVKMALSACDRHYILEKGEIRFSGDTAQLKCNPDIIDQTLGVSVERGF